MYKQQVLKILMEVGERGMSASLLSKHVYNLNCSLFYQPDVDGIRRWVWSFLQRNARSKHPLIERTGRYGYYRLTRRGITFVRQLLLSQSGNDEEEETASPEQRPVDTSPGLFD